MFRNTHFFHSIRLFLNFKPPKCACSSRTEYREYKFTVTPHMISDLTNTPRDLALHTLFHDTAKVTQAIIGSLTKETVDPRFYSEIVRSFRHSAGEEFQPNWPPMVLEEMIHPQNILNRRGSIGQIYRPGSSEKNRLSTPEMRMNKRMAEATEEEAAAANQPREYEYLMHILTVRKKQGGKPKKLYLVVVVSS